MKCLDNKGTVNTAMYHQKSLLPITHQAVLKKIKIYVSLGLIQASG